MCGRVKKMRLIDADALKDYIKVWNVGEGIGDNHSEILKAVDRQPTIEAIPVVHGEWKYYKKQGIAVCTNCSFERNLDDNFGKAIACPNCGAGM